MMLLKGKLLTPIQLIFNCTGRNSCDWCTQGPRGRPEQLPETVGTHVGTGDAGCRDAQRLLAQCLRMWRIWVTVAEDLELWQ